MTVDEARNRIIPNMIIGEESAAQKCDALIAAVRAKCAALHAESNAHEREAIALVAAAAHKAGCQGSISEWIARQAAELARLTRERDEARATFEAVGDERDALALLLPPGFAVGRLQDDLRDYIHKVTQERDAAIARAEKADRERVEWKTCAARAEACCREASGIRDAAIANEQAALGRAEKAEAEVRRLDEFQPVADVAESHGWDGVQPLDEWIGVELATLDEGRARGAVASAKACEECATSRADKREADEATTRAMKSLAQSFRENGVLRARVETLLAALVRAEEDRHE